MTEKSWEHVRGETEAWRAHMRACAGRWAVDPVHDGQDGRDLMLFVADREDPTSGVYISTQGRSAYAGRFRDADPHMGEAEFQVLWGHDYASPEEAQSRVIERAGVGALLALISPDCASPYAA